jgi:hypothetical protein
LIFTNILAIIKILGSNAQSSASDKPSMFGQSLETFRLKIMEKQVPRIPTEHELILNDMKYAIKKLRDAISATTRMSDMIVKDVVCFKMAVGYTKEPVRTQGKM